MRTVHYLGYYDVPANKPQNRSFAPSAAAKMDYVISALNRSGFAVAVASASQTTDRRSHLGKTTALGDNNTLRLFRTLAWGGIARRIVRSVAMRASVLAYLLKHAKRGETVIVYHSLGYASTVALAKRLKGFRLVLEVEEIYADVTGRQWDQRAESRVFRRADAFIFPTELLNGELNRQGKPHVIVHGVYRVEVARPRALGDGRIHVVYAGTFDPRKGGAAAAAAGLFLDERYHIHIAGFGSHADTESLLEVINDVSQRTECRVTYDGLLVGEQYVDFLQTCDIGLSTQTPGAAFGDTSFPSKVLSYMANGLRVVSIRLNALERSGVGDLLFYYDEDTPQAIARAISEVDLSQPHDYTERLKALDAEFVLTLEKLVLG